MEAGEGSSDIIKQGYNNATHMMTMVVGIDYTVFVVLHSRRLSTMTSGTLGSASSAVMSAR